MVGLPAIDDSSESIHAYLRTHACESTEWDLLPPLNPCRWCNEACEETCPGPVFLSYVPFNAEYTTVIDQLSLSEKALSIVDVLRALDATDSPSALDDGTMVAELHFLGLIESMDIHIHAYSNLVFSYAIHFTHDWKTLARSAFGSKYDEMSDGSRVWVHPNCIDDETSSTSNTS